MTSTIMWPVHWEVLVLFHQQNIFKTLRLTLHGAATAHGSEIV
jgi:hypothetical protein